MDLEKISYIGNDDVVAEEEEKRIFGKVLDKTGIESTRINDYLRYHASEERGAVIIRLASDAMLEEDLSNLEKSETLLSDSEHTKIVHESFKETLRMIGSYVPLEKLQRLFPGLDLASLDTYDFSLAKIRVFILSNESFFDPLGINYNPNHSKYTGGFATPTVQSQLGRIVKAETDVDLGDRKVVIIQELLHSTKSRLEGMHGKFPRTLTKKEKDLIAHDIRTIVVHELIHDLDVATDLPEPFMEGITQWYTQQKIVNQNVLENDELEDEDASVGYPEETEGVSILMTAMLENGVSMDIIDKAFVSADAGSRQQILDFLIKRYGTDQAEKIMEWDFKSRRESLKFIIDLESRQDSKLGKFLRDFKK